MNIDIPSTVTSPVKINPLAYQSLGKPTLRKYQDQLIDFALWAIGEFDYVLVDAPTGIGKALFEAAIMNQHIMNDSNFRGYIATPYIGLMDQLEDEFGDKGAETGFHMGRIEGRRNYPCVHEPNYQCDYGICKRIPSGSKLCPKKAECLYEHAVSAAASSNVVLSNPAYLFRAVKEGGRLDCRDLAMYDEGHNLEAIMTGRFETNLTVHDYSVATGKDALPNVYGFDFWQNHVMEMIDRVESRRYELNAQLKSASQYAQSDLSHKVFKYDTLLDKLKTVKRICDRPKLGIIQPVTYARKKGLKSILFTPVSVSGLAKPLMERVAKKSIILSATLLSGSMVASSLGLGPDDYCYIRVQRSPFPVDHRRIVSVNMGYLSYKRREETLPKMAAMIEKIILDHKDEKGVILPNSFWLTRGIYDQIRDMDEVDVYYHEDDMDERFQAIKEYMNSKEPCVLISTYVKEGYDFIDDMCRYIIVPKIPYPQIDEKIRVKMQNSQRSYQEAFGCPASFDDSGICQNFQCAQPCTRWYKWRALVTLVQMLGRAVRHDKDWARMYVLDSGFKRFIRQCGNMVPEWFREAIIW